MNREYSGTTNGHAWWYISSQPWLHRQGVEVQEFGTVRQFPLGLPRDTRLYSCQRLNQVLADTQILHACTKSITG